MFTLGFVLGAVVFGVGIAVLAHRRPDWFANVVKVVNQVDDEVNKLVKK